MSSSAHTFFYLLFASFLVWKTGTRISEEREGQYIILDTSSHLVQGRLFLGSMLHPGGKFFFFWGKERDKGVRINLVKNERMEDGGET
jgi:hypothetical protein